MSASWLPATLIGSGVGLAPNEDWVRVVDVDHPESGWIVVTDSPSGEAMAFAFHR